MRRVADRSFLVFWLPFYLFNLFFYFSTSILFRCCLFLYLFCLGVVCSYICFFLILLCIARVDWISWVSTDFLLSILLILQCRSNGRLRVITAIDHMMNQDKKSWCSENTSKYHGASLNGIKRIPADVWVLSKTLEIR